MSTPDDRDPSGTRDRTRREASFPGATTLVGGTTPRPLEVPGVSALGEATTDLIRPLQPGGAVSEDTAALHRAPVGSDLSQAPPVPGYEILGQLGRGGMGIVYKARQIGLNRVVALKMILAEGHAGGARIARFRAEAQAVARLQHPNIVQIFEVGELEGHPFFSLEFVEGGSLAERLDGTPWPPARAAELVILLGRAVHAAHGRGVVHRDLKPANVLLTPEGIPKITDFGLAKRLDVEEGHTQSGAVLGTPSYMAPEQAGHEPGAIGPATDVYALGAILYELLTGRPPFKAATPIATVAQVLHDDPVPPIRLQPRTPQDLDTICLKCLEKNPKRRYATAAELVEDLERWVRGEPISARPTPVPELAVKWARRQPVIAALVAMVVLVTFLGIAGILWQWQKARANAEYARKKEQEARTAAGQLQQSNDDLRTALDRARRNVYATVLNLARREYDDTNLSRVMEILAAQRPARREAADLRGFEWYYLDRLCHADLRTLSGHGLDVESVAYSPDGRKIASGSYDRTVKVWDASSGRELHTLAGHAHVVVCVAFGPGGRRLASGSYDRTVIVWDVATGRPRQTLRGHTDMVLSVAFHPDGRLLASAGADGRVILWEYEDGREVRQLKGHTGHVLDVAFSPDGRRIATAGQDQTVRIWDTESGRELRSIVAHPHLARVVAYSPDGHRLATLGGGDEGKVWDPETGELLVSFPTPMYGSWDLAFSPDGRWLASANSDQTVRVWDAETGRQELVLKGHTAVVNSVAFGPDSRRLASASRDRTVKIWDPTSDPEAFSIKADPINVMGLAFAPEGDRLATADVGGTVKIWDAETGRELLNLKGHTGPVYRVAFSPDGRRVASASDDGLSRVWDATGGEEVSTLRGHAARVNDVAFSPDGRRIATASVDQTVKIWDAETGRELLTLKDGPYQATAVAFHPDGRLAAASADGTVKLWDPVVGRELASWKAHPDTVSSLAFSPDGGRLATAGVDRVARVWETSSLREISVLRGHSFALLGITFSPDGRRLASAGDVTVRLWDPVTGQEVFILKGLKNMARGVAFSPDGRRLIAAGGDGTVKIWDAREPGAATK